jgi:cytochrome c biogenesis protein CcdA
MLGQHYALGMAGALIAALLFLARLRARRTSDRGRRVCIDHKESRG